MSGRVWVSWRGCSSVWACLGILARVLKCLGVLGAFWRGCSSVWFLFQILAGVLGYLGEGAQVSGRVLSFGEGAQVSGCVWLSWRGRSSA